MFTEWVHSPMQIEKVKNMELSKLFFLGFAENYARRQAITQYINKLSAVKNNLLAIKAGFEQMKLQAEPLQDVFFCIKATPLLMELPRQNLKLTGTQNCYMKRRTKNEYFNFERKPQRQKQYHTANSFLSAKTVSAAHV